MKTIRPYTVTQATIDVIESFPWDVEWHCHELFTRTRHNLFEHNSPARPYDGTIQRIMRSFRHTYNIKCVNREKSIYVKVSVEN